MIARWGPWAAPSLAWLLAACTSGPPPPLQTTTPLAPEAAAELVERTLRAEGFTVDRGADTLTVRTNLPLFVTCPPVMVGAGGGEGSRRVFTQVSARRGEAVIRFDEAGDRTLASWQTRFSGRYENRVNNTTFEQPCTSTGALEALLVRTLAG